MLFTTAATTALTAGKAPVAPPTGDVVTLSPSLDLPWVSPVASLPLLNTVFLPRDSLPALTVLPPLLNTEFLLRDSLPVLEALLLSTVFLLRVSHLVLEALLLRVSHLVPMAFLLDLPTADLLRATLLSTTTNEFERKEKEHFYSLFTTSYSCFY